jgi:Sugar (pentulose and hexulose) kinases
MEKLLPENLYLGIELGSTRIKCALIDEFGNNLENGVFNWENTYLDGNWTYDLNQALYGVGQCYLDLKKNILLKYGKKLTSLKTIGISAMMHGLIVEDENNRLLTPFRTWRNTYTEEVANELSSELNFNIPARWTLSHLYYAIKNKEPFIEHISKVSTLASYIHKKLTNTYCIGKDDASGVFPLENGKTYNPKYIKKVDSLFSKLGCNLKIENVLPPIIDCGLNAGALSPEGALILDPDGDLVPGIPFVAPEGDAATGMVSTNAIKVKSGNISAGTSIFGSFVLSELPKTFHREIDIVNTPDGKVVAMVHCNNCSSGLNECVSLINDTLHKFGVWKSENEIFETILNSALTYKGSLKHLVTYNYLSGENITHIQDGAMLIAHSNETSLSIDKVILSQLFSSFITLSLGLDILKNEGLEFNDIYVHGGIFKTKGVAQKVFASSIDEKIIVNSEAAEGGAWGMALLALYHHYQKDYSLEDYLMKIIFKDTKTTIEYPDTNLKKLFNQFKVTYLSCLEAEKLLGEKIKC